MQSLRRFVTGLASVARLHRLLGAFLITVGGSVAAGDLRHEPALDTDLLLETQIERRIAWDRELAPFRVGVEVNDSVVNLIGTVSSIAEGHRARRIANDVAGVVGVVNGITIDPALDPFAGSLLPRPSDDTLHARIAASLAGDDRVAAGAIEIRVADGHVTLVGQVPGVAQSEYAEHITSSLFGVRSVDNEMQRP